MSGLRVLRVYHSAVVSEFRQRDRLLRADYGHDVHLVCPPAWSEGGRLVRAHADPGLPLHVIPTHGRRHPILFWYDTRAFRDLIRRLRPDVIDLHEEPYSLAVAAALRVIGAEAPEARICVYTAQNILKRYPAPFRQLERRALEAASAVYPCSTGAGEVIRAKGFGGDIRVIALGATVSERPRSFAAGPWSIGFVGRLEPCKGAHVALEAYAQATAGSDDTLEIVGDGPQRPALEAMARKLGVAARVVFAGAVPQDEALRRVAGYDVVLVPSLTTPGWKEQFGRIPAQAMAAGTPVIASDSGSLPELLGGAGRLVPEADAVAMAAALRHLLADPVGLAGLSAAGRRRAASSLSWDEVAAGVDAMYREAVGTHGLGRVLSRAVAA